MPFWRGSSSEMPGITHTRSLGGFFFSGALDVEAVVAVADKEEVLAAEEAVPAATSVVSAPASEPAPVVRCWEGWY